MINPGLEPLAMAKIEKPSPHRGSDFDDFLKEQGIFEEVMSSPKIKKAIRDLGDSIQASNGKHSRPGGMRFWLPIAGF